MRMKYIKIGIIVFVSVLIITGGIGYYLYNKITTPNNCKSTFSIYIDKNTTLEDVCLVLSENSDKKLIDI